MKKPWAVRIVETLGWAYAVGEVNDGKLMVKTIEFASSNMI